jgi:serine/threonine protein kinase
LVDRNGELSLLVKDPGGHLLATLIGRPWDVGPFLRVGIGLAGALSGLHRRRLVHKDLKPSNILVDVTQRKAWLVSLSRRALNGSTTRQASHG